MRSSQVLQYVARRLQAERKQLGYSQEEFAKILGCSQAQYSRFEKGERQLGVFQLYKLAIQLQLPIDSFFPVQDEAKTDTSEEELVEAWRGRNLSGILSLVAEKFS